jgi:hypothetical protein
MIDEEKKITGVEARTRRRRRGKRRETEKRKEERRRLFKAFVLLNDVDNEHNPVTPRQET